MSTSNSPPSLYLLLCVGLFTICYRIHNCVTSELQVLCTDSLNYTGRTIPFFDTTFNPNKNPFFSTYDDAHIPTIAEAYQTSFCCALNPRRGRGLKVNSSPFLGYPKGRLPLFILVNLLAGDINLNPGPNPGPNPFSD